MFPYPHSQLCCYAVVVVFFLILFTFLNSFFTSSYDPRSTEGVSALSHHLCASTFLRHIVSVNITRLPALFHAHNLSVDRSLMSHLTGTMNPLHL